MVVSTHFVLEVVSYRLQTSCHSPDAIMQPSSSVSLIDVRGFWHTREHSMRPLCLVAPTSPSPFCACLRFHPLSPPFVLAPFSFPLLSPPPLSPLFSTTTHVRRRSRVGPQPGCGHAAVAGPSRIGACYDLLATPGPALHRLQGQDRQGAAAVGGCVMV